MMNAAPRLLDEKWKKRFDLEGRDAPEFYESINFVRNSPHAAAIRTTLEGLGASAVFCVQGVPTIVLLNSEQYERDKVVSLHAALWNQGLASLLLVLTGDTVRAFSLSRTPYENPGDEFERRCLVETLDATVDALALKNIVYGAESGRFWEEHVEFFKPKERVDQVLLENLTNSHNLLCETGLSSDAAQALLIQAMFIAYLEDREIIGEDYFSVASNSRIKDFSALLETGNISFLKQLFVTLRDDFNGDLFVAPCSFELNAHPPLIECEHLSILARFRAGQEEMAAGQLRFWGYNFKHIPIELISAVYDRFLGEREAERRQHGAYYTPMFLADCVVSQVWETLPANAAEKGEFLDPACGSGVFLVRSFQRLCENWRERHSTRTIRWDSLKNILLRLHGWDLNGSAVRVAVFSLYIALLEQVDPPDIRQLIKKGKVLPELWGKTLKCQDFFGIEPDETLVDVVIGNPPWTSRRGPDRSSVQWCSAQNLPMPGKEDAWAFTWKSMRHLRGDGIVAFLLPAMGFLHNHADTSVAARNLLIKNARLKRVVNFADLRFQLFDGAIRPAALIIFGKSSANHSVYRFEYWAPKADLNLKVKRLITLSSADRSFITSKAAIADSLVFKRRLWMSEPDAKLFKYLEELPKLGNLISDYGSQSRNGASNAAEWMIGQGYQPYNASSGSSYQMSDYVAHLPNLPIDAFTALAQSTHGLTSWHSSRVRRKGFERSFEQGPRILIPRGVSQMRLRAAYVEMPLTFQHIIQAIMIPQGEERRAKILTALLNSKIAIWYAFHGTASFGSDRPEVQQAELMRLPFPDIADTPEPERARKAAKALVSIIDKAMSSSHEGFVLTRQDSDVFTKVDELAYEYFCLSPEEITLIEDTMQFVLPAVQPHQGSFPAIWKTTIEDERKVYAETLVCALEPWFEREQAVNVRLEAHNADLAVLRLTLCTQGEKAKYKECDDNAVREVLAKLFVHIHQPLPGNFQLLPDFKLFAGKHLYLVKPMQRRFWLRATALADADAIALDLQDYAGSPKRGSRA
ncbi:MAG: N-6 DNA methylase [Nitrosomonas sp.]|nr:N-6 DNA methylase [Nitrosomonas sp.]